MIRKPAIAASLAALVLACSVPRADALSEERWTDPVPYGLFFNDYDPTFYTGFVPRVQERERIKVHLARGNQLRLRMVLPDAALDNYITDLVAKHDLYKEVIDRELVTLTTNSAWEDFTKKIEAEGLRELAGRKENLAAADWRALNVQTIDKLNPERLYHIEKDFDAMTASWAAVLKASPEPTDLEAKLDLVNQLFQNRIFAYKLSAEQETDLAALIALAKAEDSAAFGPAAETFFHGVTDNIYAIRDGKIDYYEFTAIWAAGTYDRTTKVDGRTIPMITTPGVWTFIPRDHGRGEIGMVDYISSAGYYGILPMFPYEYGGGIAYNSIHNTGISNWIQGHPLVPTEWRSYSKGSRSGKPYNRVALTSRGPVSHGCTRLNTGHLGELREMLPSTSEQMEGIVNYRNISQCYDVFDRRGDGNNEIMGVQYYFAFRHTKSRVAKQIWAQNNREDFYQWLYGDEMTYGPVGQVTFGEVCTGKFVGKKARAGKTYRGLTMYEAPYQPETLQFYKIKGVGNTTAKGYAFNRELRRVGYGYTIDRKILMLE